ncbi:MAG: hypothetical protein J6A89_08705 [Clostridia bacterium]|nr:hypothetical protein [Clostridia bacterium]
MEENKISKNVTGYTERISQNKFIYPNPLDEVIKINEEEHKKERIRQAKLREFLSTRREIPPSVLFDLNPNKKNVKRKKMYDKRIPPELTGKSVYWF